MTIAALREQAAALAHGLRQAEPMIGTDLAMEGILSLMSLTAALNEKTRAAPPSAPRAPVVIAFMPDRKCLAANDLTLLEPVKNNRN